MVICKFVHDNNFVLSPQSDIFPIICDICTYVNNIAELLFGYCEGCVKMPSVPQGAFAVFKLRAEPEKMSIARVKKTEEIPQTSSYSNKKLMEYSPVKYNSKLMKSIWGMYNQYSPHNIKKNNAHNNEAGLSKEQQQLYVVAAYAISKELDMAKTGDAWKF